jgi:hypothetical protein
VLMPERVSVTREKKTGGDSCQDEARRSYERELLTYLCCCGRHSELDPRSTKAGDNGTVRAQLSFV